MATKSFDVKIRHDLSLQPKSSTPDFNTHFKTLLENIIPEFKRCDTHLFTNDGLITLLLEASILGGSRPTNENIAGGGQTYRFAPTPK